MYVLYPRNSPWWIKWIRNPCIWTQFDYDALSVSVAFSTTAGIVIENPNYLGSHLYSAEFDIYLKLSRFSLRRLGVASIKEVDIRGRDTTLLLADIKLHDIGYV
jgi:hypothetical protein